MRKADISFQVSTAWTSDHVHVELVVESCVSEKLCPQERLRENPLHSSMSVNNPGEISLGSSADAHMATCHDGNLFLFPGLGLSD